MIKEILLPLIKQNYSNREIAKRLKVSKPTVARWVRLLRDRGVNVPQRPKGRKHLLSDPMKIKNYEKRTKL